MQFAVAVGIRADRGVVPGGDRVEAEVERLLEQGGELDPLVAAHARVRGAARGVLGDEVVDDVEFEALARSPTRSTGMPMMLAARCASIESSMVQHPRLPVRSVPGIRLRARCTPTTSWPASTARAAATAESTPPLMAARTFTRTSIGVPPR